MNGATELLDLPDAEALTMAALALVERLVPCDTVSHNAIDLALERATIHTTGPRPDAETIRVFAAHAAENPLVASRGMADLILGREPRGRRSRSPGVTGPGPAAVSNPEAPEVKD